MRNIFSHCGVEEYEISNALVKKNGSISATTGLELTIGVSVAVFNLLPAAEIEPPIRSRNTTKRYVCGVYGILPFEGQHFEYVRHQIFDAGVLQVQRRASHPLTNILGYINKLEIFY